MKVKIPREFKIGAGSYTVSLERDLKLNEGVWGETNYIRRIIRVDEGLLGGDRETTFFHEVLHTIDHEYACSLDEKDIERMANGLMVILRDVLGIEFNWEEVTNA